MAENFERIADGKALEEIRNSMGFMALERMIARMRQDAVEEFAVNSTVSRKELKGKLLVLDQIVKNVDEEIAYVRDLVRQDEEALGITRGSALDGGGTGDLA